MKSALVRQNSGGGEGGGKGKVSVFDSEERRDKGGKDGVVQDHVFCQQEPAKEEDEGKDRDETVNEGSRQECLKSDEDCRMVADPAEEIVRSPSSELKSEPQSEPASSRLTPPPSLSLSPPDPSPVMEGGLSEGGGAEDGMVVGVVGGGGMSEEEEGPMDSSMEELLSSPTLPLASPPIITAADTEGDRVCVHVFK